MNTPGSATPDTRPFWTRVKIFFRNYTGGEADKPLEHHVPYHFPLGDDQLPRLREDLKTEAYVGSRANEIVSGPYSRENMPGYSSGREGEYLPPVEELKFPDLRLTTGSLLAGSIHFGKYCDRASKEYMLCINEERDPRKCLHEGKAVTNCGFEFFGLVKDQCAREFEEYAECMDHTPYEWAINCRKKQFPFDACMRERLGIERPPPHHYTLIRVHHTDRPRPREPEYFLPDSGAESTHMPDFSHKDPPVASPYHGGVNPGPF